MSFISSVGISNGATDVALELGRSMLLLSRAPDFSVLLATGNFLLTKESVFYRTLILKL